MRIPRDIDAEKFANLLSKFGYDITRQTGSHMRLTTMQKGVHHITIPRHKTLKVGLVSAIH